MAAFFTHNMQTNIFRNLITIRNFIIILTYF